MKDTLHTSYHLTPFPTIAPYFTIVGSKVEETGGDVGTHHDQSEAIDIEEEEVEERGELLDKDNQLSEVPNTTNTDELYERVLKLSKDVQHTVVQSMIGSYDEVPPALEDEKRCKIATSKSSVDSSSSQHSTLTGEEDQTTSHDTPPHPATPTASSMSGSSQFSDRKVQKAYEKMLELDERLADLGRREREVKRQRRLLEEEMEKVGAAQPSSVADQGTNVAFYGIILC